MKKHMSVIPLVLLVCFIGCQKAEEVAEEVKVDLTGFSLRVGIIFRF